MKLDSADAGLSWSEPQALPEGILGPIKNKPIQLADSTVLSPSSTEDKGWTVHVERSTDNGRTWSRTPPLNRADEFAAIQPTFLQHSDGVLQMLCRTRQGVVSECRSRDNGRTWSEMQALALPNPDSGIDAVTLADGRHLLVYNPVSRGRSPLSLAVSDDGNVWRDVAELESEPGAEFSYPAIVQAATGTIHIAYTHKRTRIRHVTLTPDEIP
jgi:predicted neuraminidase